MVSAGLRFALSQAKNRSAFIRRGNEEAKYSRLRRVAGLQEKWRPGSVRAFHLRLPAGSVARDQRLRLAAQAKARWHAGYIASRAARNARVRLARKKSAAFKKAYCAKCSRSCK